MRQYYPLMPASGDSQGRAGPTREARLQGLPLSPRLSEPAALSGPRQAPRAAGGQGGPARRRGEAEAAWGPEGAPGGAPGPQMGRHRGACLARAQPPCLRGLLPDPEGEAGGHGRHAGRQPVHAGLPADRARARNRRAPLGAGGDGRGHAAEVHRRRQRGRDAALELHSLSRRFDHARAGGPVRLSQALDPARHLRLDPGPRRPEDQRRLRLWRRQARGTDRGAVPRHRGRPGRRGRLRRLPRLHRRDRGGDGGHRHEGLLGDLGRSRTRAASASSSIPGSTT